MDGFWTGFRQGGFLGRQKLVVYVASEMTGLARQTFVSSTALASPKFVTLTRPKRVGKMSKIVKRLVTLLLLNHV